MSGSVNVYWCLTDPPKWARRTAFAASPRRGGGAAVGVLGLEEDAQGELGLHLAFLAADLIEVQLVDPGETRQLLQLQQEVIEPVEVPAEAHLDRLLAIGGAALALHRLDGPGRELVLLRHVPDLFEDLVDVTLLRELLLEELDGLFELGDLLVDVGDARGGPLQVGQRLEL